jgi:hypothetical protein
MKMVQMTAERRRRLEVLAVEFQKILGPDRHQDGRAKTFDELEQECVAAGDWLTANALQRRVQAGREEAGEPACCPGCGRPGERLADAEVRIVQTTRGEVSWQEPDHFCRRCRRSFFPAVG